MRSDDAGQNRRDPVLLEAHRLRQEFRQRVSPGSARGTARVAALDDVSVQVRRGERVGIVGESGSGKTTLGRALSGLRHPQHGTVEFDGTDIYRLPAKELRRLRARLQIVLQDPSGILDPRMTVRQAVAEGLQAHSHMKDAEISALVESTLREMRIAPELFDRLPRNLSGGQRQRVAVARSLVLRPELIVLDEPVSALDTSVQAQLLNLLRDVQDEHDLTYVFIVHDLAVARWFCTRILVMHKGRIVEEGDSDTILRSPQHPYTAELIAAVPGLRSRGL